MRCWGSQPVIPDFSGPRSREVGTVAEGLAMTGNGWLLPNAASGVNDEYVILFEQIYVPEKDVYRDQPQGENLLRAETDVLTFPKLNY